MDKSPSPHHLASVNQEDKAVRTAGQGAGGPVKAPHPVSLLDLPDELLTAIFDQLYRSQRVLEEEEDDEVVFAVPFDQIIISKRIYALARPIWYHHLTTPYGLDLDDFLARARSRTDDLSLVHSLCTMHPPTFPSLHSSALSSFCNLTSLWLAFPSVSEQRTYEVPKAVTQALQALPALQNLRIQSDPSLTLEEESFSFDCDMPSLRSFDMEDAPLLDTLCQNGMARLESLTIRGASIGNVAIPFSTLRSLRLAAGAPMLTLVHPNQLAHAILAVPKGKLPLSSLAIEADCFYRGPYGNFGPEPFKELLAALQESQLERLDVETPADWLRWAPSEIRVPSVRVLSTDGRTPLHEHNNLAAYWNFLQTFPSLHSLYIRSFYFSEEPGSRAKDMSKLDPISLAITHPVLSTLLTILRTTTILELRYSGALEEREMRWTRRSREEDFVGEGWSLGGKNNVNRA